MFKCLNLPRHDRVSVRHVSSHRIFWSCNLIAIGNRCCLVGVKHFFLSFDLRRSSVSALARWKFTSRPISCVQAVAALLRRIAITMSLPALSCETTPFCTFHNLLTYQPHSIIMTSNVKQTPARGIHCGVELVAA